MRDVFKECRTIDLTPQSRRTAHMVTSSNISGDQWFLR